MDLSILNGHTWRAHQTRKEVDQDGRIQIGEGPEDAHKGEPVKPVHCIMCVEQPCLFGI